MQTRQGRVVPHAPQSIWQLVDSMQYRSEPEQAGQALGQALEQELHEASTSESTTTTSAGASLRLPASALPTGLSGTAPPSKAVPTT
jgi:hypothetical protein